MSQTSTTQFQIAKGLLVDIASNYGQPYIPGASLTYIDGATEELSPQGVAGKLWFALKRDDSSASLVIDEEHSINIGKHRAYIFMDEVHKDNTTGQENIERYAITGPVDWNEIYSKPISQIASRLSLTNKTLGLISLENANLENTTAYNSLSLPFLYADQADTLTAPLTLGGGDSATSGKIILDPARGGQITNNSTNTLFGFTTNDTDILTIGHSNYSMCLRSKERPYVTSTDNTLAYQSDFGTGKTIGATATAAINDSIGNKISQGYVSIAHSELSNDGYTITLKNAEEAINSSWTITDYYIGGIGDWTVNTTEKTLNTTLLGYKNGDIDTSKNIIIRIPAATPSQYGIVTTDDQSFGGEKTFTTLVAGTGGSTTTDTVIKAYGSIALGGNNNAMLCYNSSTESLDFTFI